MTSAELVSAIGAISGTSMDGIDVALVATDGADAVNPGPGRTYPYVPDLRRALLELVADPARAEHDALGELEEAVTDAHADAVAAFMREETIAKESVTVVGLHGQTILHRPERRFTRQLAKKTDRKIKALSHAQRGTEASVRAFLDSRRGRNA